MATHGSLTTRPVLSTRIHSWDHAYQGYSDKDVIANLVLEGETQRFICVVTIGHVGYHFYSYIEYHDFVWNYDSNRDFNNCILLPVYLINLFVT